MAHDLRKIKNKKKANKSVSRWESNILVNKGMFGACCSHYCLLSNSPHFLPLEHSYIVFSCPL